MHNLDKDLDRTDEETTQSTDDADEFLALPFELKALSDRQFEGHGAVFGNIDLGGDVIVEGAFSKSLSEHKKRGTRPVMLWNHDMFSPAIGRWDMIEEDEKGLHVVGTLAPTPRADEVHALLKMRAIDRMSIGYRITAPPIYKSGVRQLHEVDVWDVSPVNVAMNPKARVTAVKKLPTVRELEKLLHGSGEYSKREARVIASAVKIDLSAGGTPGDSRWDAGEAEAMDAAQTYLLKLVAGGFSR